MEQAKSSTGRPTVVRFGVFEADLRSGELRKQGVRLKLQGQPFQVLEILLQRPGEVVTRDELREAMWPQDTYVDFDHSLNTAINKLRTTLGDSGTNPRFVETLARRGYRFIAPVSAVDDGERAEEVPAPIPSAPDSQHDGFPRPARGLVRSLFELVQVMYLAMYVAALWHLIGVEHAAGLIAPKLGLAVTIAVLLLAAVGIPVRFYMFFAVAFDYRPFAPKFRRLFPALVVLDDLWALTPFLMSERIGVGLAFAATAALLYVPFGQRTLIRMGYEGGDL